MAVAAVVEERPAPTQGDVLLVDDTGSDFATRDATDLLVEDIRDCYQPLREATRR